MLVVALAAPLSSGARAQAQPAAVAPPEGEFAEVLRPCGVPYECTSGIRVRNAVVSWRFSFRQELPGIYDIVHWQFTPAGGQREYERVAQLVAGASGAAYYRIHEKVRVRDWRKLWLGTREMWRSYGPEQPRYGALLTELRAVLFFPVRLRGGEPAGSLTFPAAPRK